MLGITTDRSRYRRTNSPTGATGPTATRAVTATDWAATGLLLTAAEACTGDGLR